MRNIQWFKEELAPILKEYKAAYSSFKNGDFGDLERVELERNNKGATLDFWSSGWLGIHVYDYLRDETLFNIMLEPPQMEEKEKALRRLQELLQ